MAVGALSDCVVAEFEVGRFVRLAHEDRSTGQAFTEVTTALVREGHVGLALTAFGTMRERVAHHLVALATDEPSAVAPVITMTQQRLADCVGTVREVIARILGEFRSEGLVVTASGRVEVLDATRLARVAAGRWTRGIDSHPAASRSRTDDLDASPHAIVGVHSSGLIVYANARAESLFHLTVGEIVGGIVDRLVPASTADRHRRALAAYFETDRSPRPMAGGLEIHAIRRDGSHVPITGRLAATDTEFGQVAFVTIIERAQSPT
jgi:PAS domain S-box-containing protein